MERKDKLKQVAGILSSLLFILFDKTLGELSMMGVKASDILGCMMEVFPSIDSMRLVMKEVNM